MSVGERKKGFSIRIELGLKGIIGLGIVCLCVFVWMFLLGIWAGQTILQPFPSSGEALLQRQLSVPSDTPPGAPAVNNLPAQEEPVTVPSVSASAPAPSPPPAPAPASEAAPPSKPDFAEPVYFALQVGAFREKVHAEKSVRTWRARGYEAFFLPPEEGNDKFSRVYVGRFAELAEANSMAAEIEQKEKVKALTALLPASKFNLP